jgi:xanthine dehydrogenase iron-sulfur cluster and FAD-binding subunit A
MKSTRKIVVGLLLAAGVATAGTIAYAHPEGFGPGLGSGPGMMGGNYPGAMGSGTFGGGFGPGMRAGAWGDPVARLEAHLAAMKTELNISANQESAWQAYVTQARQQAEIMQALHAQATATAQTAPERLSQRIEFMRQRTAHLEAMSVALNNLYAVLTTEQRAIADQYFGGARLGQFNQFGPGRGR